MSASQQVVAGLGANSFIVTPTATPAAFGDAFEGGFYAGMIWNEITQSSTSKLIATGSQSFTVADMTVSPIVYYGQTLEVRSRANPNNKMVGTVTGAAGTQLTINVTSVGGSGTLSDWSIMSRYRVIIAPKATGETTRAYKNADTAAPSACQTLTEGYKATQAMIAAGTSTVYPAAHFCAGLSIGGKADWYLPARDELELLWRNLKPVTNNNYTGTDRPLGFTASYQNLGSYTDTSSSHGNNLNSSPAGGAYSTTVPGQVAAGKNFRSGESEALSFGANAYWSSTEYSATQAWVHSVSSGAVGYQDGTVTKSTTAPYVRAVRRSII